MRRVRCGGRDYPRRGLPRVRVDVVVFVRNQADFVGKLGKGTTVGVGGRVSLTCGGVGSP